MRVIVAGMWHVCPFRVRSKQLFCPRRPLQAQLPGQQSRERACVALDALAAEAESG